MSASAQPYSGYGMVNSMAQTIAFIGGGQMAEAIIGGLVVKVGSRMVDSSLRTKLNSIKLAMKEAR